MKLSEMEVGVTYVQGKGYEPVTVLDASTLYSCQITGGRTPFLAPSTFRYFPAQRGTGHNAGVLVLVDGPAPGLNQDRREELMSCALDGRKLPGGEQLRLIKTSHIKMTYQRWAQRERKREGQADRVQELARAAGHPMVTDLGLDGTVTVNLGALLALLENAAQPTGG